MDHIRPIAQKLSDDPEHRGNWMRHGGTWFAGVNILENDGAGRVKDGPSLAGPVMDFVHQLSDAAALDPAQISTIYPGYPKRDLAESETAHRYRIRRDAAHVDGLRAEGCNRRRFLDEPHGYVLGVPLAPVSGGASPMVVWDKSHEVMRAAFVRALGNVAPADWTKVDLTDVYHAARKTCFDTCERVEIEAQPGQAYVLHRLALHGMAPWGEGAKAPECGRMIAYFRPDTPGGLEDWLYAP